MRPRVTRGLSRSRARRTGESTAATAGGLAPGTPARFAVAVVTIDALAGEHVAHATTAPCGEVCELIDDVLAPAAGKIAERLAQVIHRHDPALGDDAETIAETLAS